MVSSNGSVPQNDDDDNDDDREENGRKKKRYDEWNGIEWPMINFILFAERFLY
jgi:hypothetical protein